MRPPPRPSLPAGLLALGLLLALGATGCAEDPQVAAARAHRAPYEWMEASGKRLTVADEDARTVFKLRRRARHYKVYDDALVPVGYVRLEPGDGGAPPRLSAEPRDRSERVTFTSDNPAVHELAGRLRVERTDRGWAVFNAQAQLLGLFERDPEAEQWALRLPQAAEPAWTARVEDGMTVARSASSPARLQTPESTLSPRGLLATRLTSLAPLDRAALALFFTLAAPNS